MSEMTESFEHDVTRTFEAASKYRDIIEKVHLSASKSPILLALAIIKGTYTMSGEATKEAKTVGSERSQESHRRTLGDSILPQRGRYEQTRAVGSFRRGDHRPQDTGG